MRRLVVHTDYITNSAAVHVGSELRFGTSVRRAGISARLLFGSNAPFGRRGSAVPTVGAKGDVGA